MPANRHRRRAQAARARQWRRANPAAPPRLTVRVAQGGAGVALLVVGAILLATPQGFHTARGPAFLLLAGLILLGLALMPR